MMKFEVKTTSKVHRDLQQQLCNIFLDLGAQSLRVFSASQERGSDNGAGWRVRDLKSVDSGQIVVQYGNGKGTRYLCRLEWSGQGVYEQLLGLGTTWQKLPLTLKSGGGKTVLTVADTAGSFDTGRFWTKVHISLVRDLLPTAWQLADLKEAAMMVLSETDWKDDATALRLSVAHLKDRLGDAAPLAMPNQAVVSVAELGIHVGKTVELVDRQSSLELKKLELGSSLELLRQKLTGVDHSHRPKFPEDAQADAAKQLYEQQQRAVGELEESLLLARQREKELQAEHQRAMVALQSRVDQYDAEICRPLVKEMERLQRELDGTETELSQLELELAAPECQTILQLTKLVGTAKASN